MPLTAEQKKRIIELRTQGLGFKTVEKRLNLKPGQAKKYSRTKTFKSAYPELVGFISKVSTQGMEMPEEIVKARIREKQPGFEYIGGYENCESKIKIRCLKCGNILKRNAQILRKNKKVQCPKCLKIKHDLEIKHKLLLKERDRQKRIARTVEKEQGRIKRAKELKRPIPCKNCGELFSREWFNQKYCSKECARNFGNRRRETRKRHRISNNGEIDYSITLERLIKRDRGRCKICGGRVNPKADYNSNDYPSIDHIIAITNGGTHTWGNVQLAHRGCNTEKRNRKFYIGRKGQLTMAI